ncbi:MAG: hypothetical protein DI629_20625, partial [Mesorhizobium amorphae]
AAALEMELRVFLADVLAQNTAQNDLRLAIIDAFDREGIEMASTPRAVVEHKEEFAEEKPEEAPARPAVASR